MDHTLTTLEPLSYISVSDIIYGSNNDNNNNNNVRLLQFGSSFSQFNVLKK